MTFKISKPGLFITGTDTGVGKTVVTCAIAANLRSRGLRVGVCKPYATGCRRDREGLVSEDAEALAHFSDCRLPLATINPMRYHAPLAPAVAGEYEDGDRGDIQASLQRIDPASDVLLIEGVGGVMVPLDAGTTVLDLMRRVGYPVIVVTRGDLGTLNHTAMTCAMIHRAGLRLAGLVINRYHADSTDLAEATNPHWLAKQNKTTILATIPDTPCVEPHRGRIPPEIIEAAGITDWQNICKTAKSPA